MRNGLWLFFRVLVLENASRESGSGRGLGQINEGISPVIIGPGAEEGFVFLFPADHGNLHLCGREYLLGLSDKD